MSQDRSDWKPNPVVERALAQDRRQERRRRWDVALLAAASIGLCPLSCLGTCLSFGSARNASLFALLPFASIILFIVSLVRYSRDAMVGRERRLALRQEFGDVGGWLVEIVIRQGEAVSGRDVGVVWFEENRLLLNGARTSFALGSEDVRSEVREGHSVIDGGSNLFVLLRERTEVGPMSVGLRFVPHEPEAKFYGSNEVGFRHALRGWLVAGAPGKGQLPPRSLGPDLPSVASLQRRAILVAALWPTLILTTLIVASTSGIPSASFLAVVFFFLTFWAPARSPRQCWKAVRDRRGLEAYNKD